MSLIIGIVWAHWWADFVTQTDDMAKKKSTSFGWLTFHVFTYSIPLLIWFGWRYAAINGVAHWIVDAITSRITSRLWAKKQVHNFFVVIGFDQAVHITVLLLTMDYITGSIFS